jgi:hypothetical protein
MKPNQNIKVRYWVRVIHFQDPFTLVILKATKKFITKDLANFMLYKYEYIQKIYLLFLSRRTILKKINSSYQTTRITFISNLFCI